MEGNLLSIGRERFHIQMAAAKRQSTCTRLDPPYFSRLVVQKSGLTIPPEFLAKGKAQFATIVKEPFEYRSEDVKIYSTQFRNS